MIITEAEAYEAMLAHHAILDRDVKSRSQVVVGEVGKGNSYQPAVADLVSYLNSEVLPHALAEEDSIYKIAAGIPGMSSMVQQMTLEHRALADAITSLKSASGGTQAARESAEISALFSSHVAKENDLILPRLLADPEVDLSVALTQMHELFEAAKRSVSSLESSETPASD